MRPQKHSNPPPPCNLRCKYYFRPGTATTDAGDVREDIWEILDWGYSTKASTGTFGIAQFVGPRLNCTKYWPPTRYKGRGGGSRRSRKVMKRCTSLCSASLAHSHFTMTEHEQNEERDAQSDVVEPTRDVMDLEEVPLVRTFSRPIPIPISSLTPFLRPQRKAKKRSREEAEAIERSAKRQRVGVCRLLEYSSPSPSSSPFTHLHSLPPCPLHSSPSPFLLTSLSPPLLFLLYDRR